MVASPFLFSMNHSDFLFFDLQELTPGKPFPGFAPGAFMDMLGRQVEFNANDLPDFITNTLKRINEYKARNMPGLPIDAQKHDKGDAAGWIVGAELGQVTDSAGGIMPVIHILAEWTALGVGKIREKVQTNFSPTVDLENKVIVGGSLTNWPASVDANGIPLFTAVELAQGIHYLQSPDTAVSPSWYNRLKTELLDFFKVNHQAATSGLINRGDEHMTIELTQEQLDALVDTRVKQSLAELDSQRQGADLAQLAAALGVNADAELSRIDQLAELVQNRVNLEWQQRLATLQRENQYTELANRVTGGTAEAPRGIPVDAGTLKGELLKLEPEQAKFWSGLLETAVTNGLTDFSELGHGKKPAIKQAVPEFAVSSLKAVIEAGNSPAEFFAAAGLGSADDYDLSAYVGEK